MALELVESLACDRVSDHGVHQQRGERQRGLFQLISRGLDIGKRVALLRGVRGLERRRQVIE